MAIEILAGSNPTTAPFLRITLKSEYSTRALASPPGWSCDAAGGTEEDWPAAV
jgi:hypothetical protein